DRRARLIFLEPVAVTVSILVDPGQATFGGLKMPLQYPPAGSGTPGCVQRDQIDRRAISGALIWGVRNKLEMRERAEAQLLEDVSRFCIPVGVVLRRLQRAEEIQCAPGELRIDQVVLKRGDQAVASEWGDEPGKAGRGQERLAIPRLDRKAERGHILECTA